MSTLELTGDKELAKTQRYQVIKEVLGTLIKSEGMHTFFGNCVAAADIIQTMLAKAGISSKILECQVSIIKTEKDSKNFLFVGYDNYSYPGEIDTHTIVITEEEHPIIIDLSLGHTLPSHRQVIVERANGIGPGTIADIKIDNIQITYSEKKNLRLAQIHQKNLLQRMIAEQNTEKTLKFLKNMIIIAITLGITNFILNTLLIIFRLFDITWT